MVGASGRRKLPASQLTSQPGSQQTGGGGVLTKSRACVQLLLLLVLLLLLLLAANMAQIYKSGYLLLCTHTQRELAAFGFCLPPASLQL